MVFHDGLWGLCCNGLYGLRRISASEVAVLQGYRAFPITPWLTRANLAGNNGDGQKYLAPPPIFRLKNGYNHMRRGFRC